MSSLDSIVQLGKELGYEGEYLQDFIKTERELERERRAEERERLKMEEQNLKCQLEIEKIKQTLVQDNGDGDARTSLVVPVKGPKLLMTPASLRALCYYRSVA